MKTLKFRAWENHSKYMIENFQIKTNFQPVINKKEEDDSYYWNYNVMQYTGLKDKKGKEIYEGDILNDGKGGLGVVQFTPPCFSVYVEGDENPYYYLGEGKFWSTDSRLEYTEIVGNIYENTKLTKKAHRETVE